MFPELSSERFELKQILPSDQGFIFKGLSHPEVIPYYGVSYKSFEESSAQIDFYNELIRTETGNWWKIVERKSQEPQGVIGYNHYQPRHQKCEIGYWLLPEFWKKGIINDVLPLVITYLQQVKKIHRIEALIEEGNEPSFRVIEKAGFNYEGTLRDCEIKNERFISLRIYSLISKSVVKT